MYKILGTDLKEYGPVSAETIHQWIADGRANHRTQAKLEGMVEWKTLAEFPEFAGLFSTTAAFIPPLTPEDWAARAVARDYNLEIGECLSRGWELTTKNFGVVGVAAGIFLLIQMGMGAMGSIPFVGILISLGSILVTGPLMAGVYMIFLKTLRKQPATVGEIFAGFGPRYGQLLLSQIVSPLLVAVSAIPGGILIAIAIIAMGATHAPGLGLVVLIVGCILAAIPIIYLSTSWMFALLLVMDKNLDFWLAMQTSRKMTGKHFGMVLLFLVVIGFVASIGVIGCCIGIFFTMPLALGATVRGYEIIFDEPVA